MSNNNGNNPSIQMTCPKCGQVWAQPLPPAEISNNLRSSCITIPHERLQRCPNNKCREPFVFMVQGVQLQFNCIGITPQQAAEIEGSSIVRPNLGLVG